MFWEQSKQLHQSCQTVRYNQDRETYIAFGNLDIIISGFHLVVSVEGWGTESRWEETKFNTRKWVFISQNPLTSNTQSAMTFKSTKMIKKKNKDISGDFPGGPVVKTACSQGRGFRFHPWSGNYSPHTTTKAHEPQLKILHAVTKTQCSQIN